MKTSEHPDDIIQIIPATGWTAVYGIEGAERSDPLVAWGLTRSGGVVPLDTDDYGIVDNAREMSNFIRVAYAP